MKTSYSSSLNKLESEQPQKEARDKKGFGSYYPYGLTMAGISDKALKTPYAENKYRANGGDELQNKEFSDGSGLEMYDANFRGYDPQIGRFWQIDPLAIVTADYSLYSFAIDNPILFNDPLGLDTTCPGWGGKIEALGLTGRKIGFLCLISRYNC